MHLGLTVRARVFPTKRASESPLAALAVEPDAVRHDPWLARRHDPRLARRARHASTQDEVTFTDQEVAASGLDYLALGHWHSFREGRAGRTAWAYSGAPEPVALDQDGAGQVLLVDARRARPAQRQVTVEPRTVGRSRFRKVEIDAATVTSQAELERTLRELADPDLRARRAPAAACATSDLDLQRRRARAPARGVVPAPARA